MKRLVFLLAVCLSFAARAQHVRTSPLYGAEILPYATEARQNDLWQRNNGVWEKVVRVSKEAAYYDLYDLRAVTNGYVAIPPATNVIVVTTYLLVTTVWRKFNYNTRTGIFTVEPQYGYDTYTNRTRRVELHEANIDSFLAHVPPVGPNRSIEVVSTNISSYFVISSPRVDCGELPCRFGVPQSIVVNPPYTDLMEQLPLDYPETYVRIRTGFDGYLLIRFEEDEMRLTIKRLLPEKLPYEHPRRNIRVLRDDLLNGV